MKQARDARANEVYGRLNPMLALSRSHWKVRLTRSFPSLFSRAFISRFASSTCVITRYRSTYQALSLLDASMHIRTHLKPLFHLPFPSVSLFFFLVSLNLEETFGCAASRGLFGMKRSRVTDFDRNHETWP